MKERAKITNIFFDFEQEIHSMSKVRQSCIVSKNTCPFNMVIINIGQDSLDIPYMNQTHGNFSRNIFIQSYLFFSLVGQARRNISREQVSPDTWGGGGGRAKHICDFVRDG